MASLPENTILTGWATFIRTFVQNGGISFCYRTVLHLLLKRRLITDWSATVEVSPRSRSFLAICLNTRLKILPVKANNHWNYIIPVHKKDKPIRKKNNWFPSDHRKWPSLPHCPWIIHNGKQWLLYWSLNVQAKVIYKMYRIPPHPPSNLK